MFRILPTVITVLVVGAAGALHGVWTGRWTPSGSTVEASQRLTAVPWSVGDWSSQELEISQRELEVACADGFLSRRYTNRRSGKGISVLVLCGRPGPISVHTPDVCYRGSGFEEVGDPIRHKPKGESDSQLLVRRFRKDAATPVQLRIFYGWSTDGSWEAPDSPRVKFAGRPLLYKIYLIHELQRDDEPLEGDPALDLFRALQPQLRMALISEQKSNS